MGRYHPMRRYRHSQEWFGFGQDDLGVKMGCVTAKRMDMSLSRVRHLVVLLVFSSRFIILRFPMTVDTLITCLSLKKTNFTAFVTPLELKKFFFSISNEKDNWHLRAGLPGQSGLFLVRYGFIKYNHD